MSEEENNTTISSVFGQCVEVTEEHLDVWNHTNNVCYVQWMQDVAVEHSAVLGWDSKRYIDSGLFGWFGVMKLIIDGRLTKETSYLSKLG